MSIELLLIDDDATLYELLGEYLGSYDFVVTWAPDGPTGLQKLTASAFDVVVCDVMMPGMDGLEVVQNIRRTKDIPIVMLTARGDDADRIVGLEMGADDYLPKPFNPRELLARLRAVLRRSARELVSDVLEVQHVEVDVEGRRVRAHGEEVELTAAEFDVLVALARRVGRVVSRETILSESNRDDVFVGERAVDVHISHLRKKLDDRDAQLIKTVRGVGYVLAR
jgi:DNA-binding response OmpR family regulator